MLSFRLLLFSLCILATWASDSQDTEEECNVESWKPTEFADWVIGEEDIPAHNSHDVSSFECFSAIELVSTNQETVTSAISSIPSMQKDKNTVFVMLNGQNNGIYVKVGNKACLGTFAMVAARALGVKDGYQLHSLRLFSPAGQSISSWEQLVVADYLVHILLYEEKWVWPGIEIGFQWTVGPVEMTTVALRPKVILVDNIVSDDEIDEIILHGGKKLYRSPEKHYSSDDKFKNYRTSETGSLFDELTPAVAELRKRCQLISRLPQLNHVEPLQLLKYIPGKWYKSHQDLFHNPKIRFKDTDADGLAIPVSVSGWSRFWRHVLHQAAEFVEKVANSKIDEKEKIPPIIQAAADFYFSRGLDDLFPDETNQSFQQAMHDLALKFELTQSKSTRLAGFNVLVEGNEDILDEIIPIWLSSALNQHVSDSDIQTLLDLGEESQMPFHVPHLERNRILTILPYLSHVPKGGETVFPNSRAPSLFGTNTEIREGMSDCSRGVHVPPKKGSAALFYHLLPNGLRDELSTHGGCPPVEGTKYAVNVFCWNIDWEVGINYFR